MKKEASSVQWKTIPGLTLIVILLILSLLITTVPARADSDPTDLQIAAFSPSQGPASPAVWETGGAASSFPGASATLLTFLPEETGEATDVITFISIVIGLLFIASLVGIAANRLRLPYTVGLVLIGLALSLRGQARVEVPPEIFLGLLVPPLVFEAAFHLRARDLLKNLTTILTLAIPGVLLTTLLVSGVVAWGTGFPIGVALVFGALVAATDPVAVVALFRSLGVPKQLEVLLEGESLFNDGTAIVVFNLMVAVTISGVFEPLNALFEFLIVAGGGLAVGFIISLLISQAIRFIDDPRIETTLTTVVAFGSYIIAEQFHVSGVLAVVAAGLVSGNMGPQGMSPTTRILVFNFWEYAAFLANSVVFLLIGFQIDLQLLVSNWQVILWAILAVLVARAVSIYGLSWVGRGIPTRFKHVLFWGGLRGAISLALAISLPESLGIYRGEIQAMAFGVVLFTLLVQGMSMKPLINRMGLIRRSEAQEEYERRHARSVMARTAFETLKKMYEQGFISSHIWETLSTPIQQHVEALSNAVAEVLQEDPTVEQEVLDTAMREMLLSQRSSLNTLVQNGIISEETYTQLALEVDTALTESKTNILDMLLHRSDEKIRGMMAMVVQEPDVENIIAALNRAGIQVTRLSSAGGFLKRKSTTLLAGIPEGKSEVVKDIIQKSTQRRVEYLPAANGEAPNTTPITVGAMVFTFDVERYEEM